jgi:diguanylate cyclase (GGDEF)-like protein
MLAKTRPDPIRVLIIDDSRLIRTAASRMFGDGFEVLLAVDGADGWNIIQRDADIQVVFTDLVMPVMGGFELLKLIRTSNRPLISQLPVIVATGADNPEIAKQKAFSLGATDFITKPFNSTGIRTRALSYANLHQSNRELRQQTTLDDVTGLLNTLGLERQLSKELAFVTRHESSMAVMSLQIDGFKDLFISVGRAGSEAIIKKVAALLSSLVRKEDTVARTSVSGFSVLMPLVDAQNGLELADRICRAVESLRVRLDGRRLAITLSIGVCILEKGNQADTETLLEAADRALEKAVSLGRSQLYQLTIKDYLAANNLQLSDSLSIDQLILQLQQGHEVEVLPKLTAAAQQLLPLIQLMSAEQQQLLLVGRAEGAAEKVEEGVAEE